MKAILFSAVALAALAATPAQAKLACYHLNQIEQALEAEYGEKPAFAGRDALLRERQDGPARRLWGLHSNDRGIPRPGMQVTDDAGSQPVGVVTSGTFSPSLRSGIGLALLSADLEPGDEVTVDVRGRPSKMSVVRPPFVERSPS